MINQRTDKTFLEVEMIYEDGDIKGIPDTVMQVFFRTCMGEQYFTFKSFLGGLLAVLVVRVSFLLGVNFNFGYPFHALDIVLILYILLGAWHLIQPFRLKDKGQRVHSCFMGYSHLFFISKGLFWLLNLFISLPFRLLKTKPFQFGARTAFYFTYTIIEPLVTLGLAAFFYFYLKATIAPILFVVAAMILFWTAINKVSSARQIYVDRTDGEIFSESIKTDMLKANDRQMELQGMSTKKPPISSHSPLPPAPKAPLVSPNREIISVADMLKKKDKGDAVE